MDQLKQDMIKEEIKRKYNTGCFVIMFRSVLDAKKVLKNQKEFLTCIKPDKKDYFKYNLGNWDI